MLHSLFLKIFPKLYFLLALEVVSASFKEVGALVYEVEDDGAQYHREASGEQDLVVLHALRQFVHLLSQLLELGFTGRALFWSTNFHTYCCV